MFSLIWPYPTTFDRSLQKKLGASLSLHSALVRFIYARKQLLGPVAGRIVGYGSAGARYKVLLGL